MSEQDQIITAGGPNSNSSIFLRINNQFEEAKKLLIFSSFDFLRWKSPEELKEIGKRNSALSNIYLGSIYSGYLHGFKQRTVHQPHIMSIQAKRHFVIDFENENMLESNQHYLSLVSTARIQFTPKLIDFDPVGNSKAIDMLAEARKLLEKRDFENFDSDVIKQLIDKKISMTNQKTEVLRWKKQKAWVMKFKDRKSNQEILTDLSLTPNQLKDAFKNWKPNNFIDIYIEKRGAHKKANSYRSADSLKWVREYLSKQDRPVTVKEVHKAFQDEKLGKKCSKSLIYKMIKEDLNMKFGVPKKVMEEKNSVNNKSYRVYVCQKLLDTFTRGVKVISIDETGFSDYVDKVKTWYDPSNKIKMEVSKKRQSISYSLLLATCQDYIIGYYIVEGAINSAIYLSFLKRVVDDIPFRSMQNSVVFIMDNAKIHKSIVVKDYMARQVKHEWLYMPAYSPEINFIENIFNRIKRAFRKMPVTNNK